MAALRQSILTSHGPMICTLLTTRRWQSVTSASVLRNQRDHLLLGVRPGFTRQDLKAAFHATALRSHPDHAYGCARTAAELHGRL